MCLFMYSIVKFSVICNLTFNIYTKINFLVHFLSQIKIVNATLLLVLCNSKYFNKLMCICMLIIIIILIQIII